MTNNDTPYTNPFKVGDKVIYVTLMGHRIRGVVTAIYDPTCTWVHLRVTSHKFAGIGYPYGYEFETLNAHLLEQKAKRIKYANSN